MQCIIHKYAKTDEDIIRLEEMIGLKQAQLQRKTIRERMKDEGRQEGREEGIKEIIMEMIKNPNITVDELINKYPTPNLTKGK